jgi:3-hydroxyacyl-[acyl-carrier-protein] dehydratase
LLLSPGADATSFNRKAAHVRHRPPIDRPAENRRSGGAGPKNQSAIGFKNVTINEPYFQGHFPQEPVMPGVLIVEAMAQTAGVMVVESLGKIDEELLVYFMTIDNCRFRAKVSPGDVLELHVRITRSRGTVFRFAGQAKVGAKLVAEAEFSAMIIDKDDKRRGG